MRTLLRKLRRDLRSRGLRNALTLLAVVLGVAGVITISNTTRNLANAQRLTYVSSHQADLVAFTSGISSSTLSLVRHQENVISASSRTVTFTRMSTGRGLVNLRLDGISDFSNMEIETLQLTAGRFPGPGEILMDESARALTPFEIGDVVAVQQSVADNPTYFTISGLTRSPAMLGAGILNQATGYATASDVQALTGRSLDNYLLVRVADHQRASETANQIGNLLNLRGIATGSFEVRDPEHFVGSRELDTLLFLLRIFSILGAILSGFLVANTVSAVLSEETRQIGVLKSLGASRLQVVATYLIYALGLGIAGGVIGLVLGLFLSQGLSGFLTDIAGLRQPAFSVAPADVALALGVGIAVTVFAALIPALGKSSRWPAALLGQRALLSSFETRILSRITNPIGRLHAAVAAGMRNVTRRRGRSLMTIGLIAIAVAAFLSTQALSQSVNGTVNSLYALYGADGWIYFNQTTSRQIVDDIRAQSSVVDAEDWRTASGAIGTTPTDIWGMPADDPMYRYRLTSGRWFRPGSPVEVVLTSNLAGQIQASVGEVLNLDIGSERIRVQVVGIVNDSSTYLGSTTTGKVFTCIADLNRITGNEGQTDIIALQFWSSNPRDVDATLASLEEKYRELHPETLAAYADQESARRAINILTFLLRAMVFIVGVVGLAGIANTLLIGITERRREYGIMRAIGGQTRHVLMLLVTEGIALAIIGMIFGIAIGYPVSHLLVDLTGQQLFALQYRLDIPNLALTFLIGLGIVAAISAGPGLLASRLLPARVLRYE